MFTDICTSEVSLTNPKALSEWNGVVLGVLAHGQSAPVHLGRLLELEPGFAMGHALKGLSALMLARREMVPVAKEASATAQAALAAGAPTARERLWCAALQDWLDGVPSSAIERMEAALRLNRADTISMKLSHGIRFILGDAAGMRSSVEAVLPAHGPDHPLRGYVLGCLAFAMEETGAYDAAEKLGLEGLAYAPDDAWGLHAVAHVYDMTHRTANGIALIDSNHAAWDHCNNFRFHVWWHKALLHLDEGDVSTVLALYDDKIRSDKTDDYRDFSNASSLLVRLELEGIDIGDRWAELADLAETRSADGCLTFADLHYMLALTGDKREDAAARLTARIAQDARGATEAARVMSEPGVAVSQGLSAFSDGRYKAAFAHLHSVHPRFSAMGGSHAQRDVFERVTIEAGLRAGALSATRALLEKRIAQRKGAVDAFAETRLNKIDEAWSLRASVAAE
ncbi:tetratricopeptide repeat protein [Tropicimonas sp. S265A]|uniref:tetratricopeptide repeat protein n=1 Tax=Tropicimonas sp. S265A TaxID=3415134 RepID=UPI003C7AF868